MAKVSVICIDCDYKYIDDVLINQDYQDLEIVEVTTGESFFEDIVGYINSTSCEYITFLESGQKFTENKICNALNYMMKSDEAGIEICRRNFIEEDGTIVAHTDLIYRDVFQNKIFNAYLVITECFKTGCNLIGNLSMIMLRKSKISLDVDTFKNYMFNNCSEMKKVMLMYHLIYGQNMMIEEQELVSTYVENYNKVKYEMQNEVFEKNMKIFFEQQGCIDLYNIMVGKNNSDLCYDKDIKKEITAFYTDRGEYYNLLPIIKEAEKRGYDVKMSDDLTQKAEIGLYCQHCGYPQNSKFSLVLLHDMDQGHNRWPNIWEIERWNNYDLGILPGNAWKERWERCGFQYYTKPRCGVYALGYPKSDSIKNNSLKKEVEELKNKLNFKYQKSVLYAPSWENDEKEDDFVRALVSLPINLVIKQADWPKEYSDIIQNIKEMRHLHEGKYDNVYYIEPQQSIMVALELCDLMISDESSIMTEALLFGKPSIAVSDWLIPDTNPKRFAETSLEYVKKCKKVELREQVENFLKEQEKSQTVNCCEEYFNNCGNVCKDIVDSINYFLYSGEKEDFKKWKIESKYMPDNFWS